MGTHYNDRTRILNVYSKTIVKTLRSVNTRRPYCQQITCLSLFRAPTFVVHCDWVEHPHTALGLSNSTWLTVVTSRCIVYNSLWISIFRNNLLTYMIMLAYSLLVDFLCLHFNMAACLKLAKFAAAAAIFHFSKLYSRFKMNNVIKN